MRALDVLEHLLGEDDVDARVLERQRDAVEDPQLDVGARLVLRVPTSTPIQRTSGSAARNASTECRGRSRGRRRAAGAVGQERRDEATPPAPARTIARGSPVAAPLGDRHRQAAIGHRHRCYEGARVLRIVLARRAHRPRAVGVGARRALLLAEARRRARAGPGLRRGPLPRRAARGGRRPVGVEIAEAASSARGRTCRTPTCACSRTARSPPATASSTSCGARRCSSTSRTSARRCSRSAACSSPAGACSLTVPHASPGRGAAALRADFDPLGQHVHFFTRRSLARHARRDGLRAAASRRRAACWSAGLSARGDQARRRDDVGDAARRLGIEE